MKCSKNIYENTRATIYTISSNMTKSIYMNKTYENNDNSEKMLKLNDILSNALLYLHETPFSFASSLSYHVLALYYLAFFETQPMKILT